MKKTNYTIGLLCGVLALQTACVNDVPYKGKDEAPMLVLNGVLNENSPVTVSAGKSVFFLDEGDPTRLTDATVNVSINGAEESLLYSNADGVYTGNLWVRQGDEVRLSASAPGLRSVSAVQTVPAAVPFRWENKRTAYTSTSSSWLDDTYINPTDSVCQVSVYIQDKGTEANFYRLTFAPECHYYGNPMYSGIIGETAEEEIQTNHKGLTMFTWNPHYRIPKSTLLAIGGQENESDFLSNNYFTGTSVLLFSDEYINGKTDLALDFDLLLECPFSIHDVEYYNPWLTFDREMEFVYSVALETLSEDYYYYLLTTESYDNNDMMFFTEPVQVHGNITHGLGILGAYSGTSLQDSLSYTFK